MIRVDIPKKKVARLVVMPLYHRCCPGGFLLSSDAARLMQPPDSRWQRNAADRKLWRSATGRAIQYLRRRHQMPQPELARLLDISQGQLSKYELGISRLDDVLALQLAYALGVPPTRLYAVRYRLYRALSRRAVARDLAGMAKRPVKPRPKRPARAEVDETS